jgi:hypothetical protein
MATPVAIVRGGEDENDRLVGQLLEHVVGARQLDQRRRILKKCVSRSRTGRSRRGLIHGSVNWLRELAPERRSEECAERLHDARRRAAARYDSLWCKAGSGQHAGAAPGLRRGRPDRGPDGCEMAERRFKPGDHVSWNSEAGRVSGHITRVVTAEEKFKGYTVHASEEEPQYEIKSDKTDHIAMHKGSALRKLKG